MLSCDPSPPAPLAITKLSLLAPLLLFSHTPSQHASTLWWLLQDDKYWSRRYKNNEAAKRSRDARRLKENQITVRAAFLERENAALRQEVADMHKELGRCRNILNKFESRHGDLWGRRRRRGEGWRRERVRRQPQHWQHFSWGGARRAYVDVT